MATSVKIFADQGADTMSVTSRKCGICHDSMSKYSCPRCNVSYCSVECFKSEKHSGCSESFYKDCFTAEMKNSKIDEEEKLRIMKILKDFEEEDGLKDDNVTSLEQRLEGVNLDDTGDIWSRLIPEEREEFRKSIQSGFIIQEWKPWWLYHDTSLIEELSHQDTPPDKVMQSSPKYKIPEHELQVPELKVLLHSKEPSPLIRNNVVEVLYCYAFFCHKYNGDIPEFGSQIAHDVIESSRFLKEGITSTTCEETLQVAMDKCQQVDQGNNNMQLSMEAILDVHHILLGSDKDNLNIYVKAAIAELHSCCKVLRRDVKKAPLPNLSSKGLLTVMKKLEFLLSWTLYFESGLLALAVDALTTYNHNMKLLQLHEADKQTIGSIRGCKPTKRTIIEELE